MKNFTISNPSLADLNDGQSAIIEDINLNGILRRRLFDLGLIPGTTVNCVRHSPAGNPAAYYIRGATIALRKEDTANIYIRSAVEEYHE